MAILAETEPILEAARHWRDRCLLEDGSVFTDQRLWTIEHIEELNEHFVENLDMGSGTFLEKLHTQLGPTSRGARKLAGEMQWVLVLFPSNLGRENKVATVRTVWEWSGEELEVNHPLLDKPLRQGIGSGGMGFNAFRWAEFAFLIVLTKDWKEQDRAEQERLLSDPWDFAEWLDTIPGAQNRQFRHMLLHLLFPNTFERVATSVHKGRIDRVFSQRLPNTDGAKGTSYLARDRRLFKVREMLQEEHPGTSLDFYGEPLKSVWDPDGEPSPDIPDPPEIPAAGDDQNYSEPPFETIYSSVRGEGLRISEQTLRRYHLALKVRGFVVLSGVSGTGKTWLAESYAAAVGARHRIVSVAPNWTTNEDLLGYYNPLDDQYHDTPFSLFLREASEEYEAARHERRSPRPFHLVLDEMNLARVEYYFARFLSVMEVRARGKTAEIDLGPRERVLLTPNLRFIGTVNVDETTHAFADKVYDRAQLIELEASREALEEHLAGVAHAAVLLELWDELRDVAPFAFRVLDEIGQYLKAAKTMDVAPDVSLDEQILQKVLPKIRGANPRVGSALERLQYILDDERFPLSRRKVDVMSEAFHRQGFASYF